MASRSLFAFGAMLLFLIGVLSEGDSKSDRYKVLKGEWCGEYNCYELLDVSPDVEFRDIKSRYNNLSLALHPDKNPNQTAADKERYVRINKAYEILSSKRRDYDEYLRIKVSMDSPVEHPIVVALFLYFVMAYVVLFYQRQTQQKVKEAILKNNDVVRYYWEKKGVDLTGKRKKAKKKRKGGDRRSPKQIIEETTVQQINSVLSALNMRVPEWRPTVPTYSGACWDVFHSVTWAFTELLFQARWTVKYRVCGMPYSQDDREHLCMKHFQIGDEEWEAMGEQKQKEFLQRRGPWNKGGAARGKKKRN